MPISLHVDADRHLIVARVRDPFDMGDAREAIDRAVPMLDLDARYAILSDHRGLAHPLDPEQVRQLVGHLLGLASRVAGTRWAIVTDSDLSFGMMRMLSVHAEAVPMAVMVFRDVTAAEAWLAAAP